MPATIAFIDKLCSVDLDAVNNQEYAKLQVHNHTFTCYKNADRNSSTRLCRFGIPFWPCRSTLILLPMAKEDKRREPYRSLGFELKQTLESKSYRCIDDFLAEARVTYEEYLDVIRATLRRPTVIFKRDLSQIWVNTFHPCIANTLKSNMDFQFILEEYSCASYVVDYINKTIFPPDDKRDYHWRPGSQLLQAGRYRALDTGHECESQASGYGSLGVRDSNESSKTDAGDFFSGITYGSAHKATRQQSGR